MLVNLMDCDEFATRAHAGQTRNTGDATAPAVPYIVHPRAVRDILLHEHPDAEARAPWILATALLHDVLEDCMVTHQQISQAFGQDVSAAVRALSKEMKVNTAAKKTDEQYWQVLAQSPLAVRQVKAADRIDNLRSCLRWRHDRIAGRYLVETPRVVLPMIAEDPFLYATLAELLAQVRRMYALPAPGSL
jgi:guanosine-3',5'-bis(diphosphate) 3'-pyrophosphohydrolase